MEIVTVEVTPVVIEKKSKPKRVRETLTETPLIKQVIDLPKKPYIGLTFGTYGTNSIGTIEEIIGITSKTIRYSFSFNPEKKFTEPYNEIRKFSFMKVTND